MMFQRAACVDTFPALWLHLRFHLRQHQPDKEGSDPIWQCAWSVLQSPLLGQIGSSGVGEVSDSVTFGLLVAQRVVVLLYGHEGARVELTANVLWMLTVSLSLRAVYTGKAGRAQLVSKQYFLFRRRWNFRRLTEPMAMRDCSFMFRMWKFRLRRTFFGF